VPNIFPVFFYQAHAGKSIINSFKLHAIRFTQAYCL
jgi:hypothetical protein